MHQLIEFTPWGPNSTPLGKVIFWILAAIIFGRVRTLFWAYPPLVWALSALASGGLLGFLYGQGGIASRSSCHAFSLQA
jgi:hypothetical protein